MNQHEAVCSQYVSRSSYASTSLSMEVEELHLSLQVSYSKVCEQRVCMKPKELSPDGMQSSIMLLSSSDL